MKAAVIHAFKGLNAIEIEEIATPTPKATEVQIKVAYAGLNPVDWKVCDGLLKDLLDYSFPITLGWDVSGTVSEVGSDVTNLKAGDQVFAYCRKEKMHDGACAEYICLESAHVVKIPAGITLAQASVIPLSSLTAWQSLHDTAHITPGDDILIHAGAGGVGSFAIQIAKNAGARVITTASPVNHDYVSQLGADKVIDYTTTNFVDAVRLEAPNGVDIVFDTVGGKTLKSSYDAAKDGGRLVTIAGIVDEALSSKHHLDSNFVFVAPNGPELQEIAKQLASKKILPPRVREYPLEDIDLALRQSREGHVQGKLTLKVA